MKSLYSTLQGFFHSSILPFFNSSTLLLSAVCAMAMCGCSSSDDDAQAPPFGGDAPDWKVVFSMPQGDIQGCPDWKEVNFFEFENTMTAMIFFPDGMRPYVSEDDRLASIIDGEVRDIAVPVKYVDDEYIFMAMIPFENDDQMVEVQYYNAKTNQTFVLKDAFSVWDDTVGSQDTGIYVLLMERFCSMYINLAAKQPFTPASGDRLAIFYGDTCCGVGEAGPGGQWSVDGVIPSEWKNPSTDWPKLSVRYYSAEEKTIYSTPAFIDLGVEDSTYINVQFQ